MEIALLGCLLLRSQQGLSDFSSNLIKLLESLLAQSLWGGSQEMEVFRGRRAAKEVKELHSCIQSAGVNLLTHNLSANKISVRLGAVLYDARENVLPWQLYISVKVTWFSRGTP